jgi:hypothetical protein
MEVVVLQLASGFYVHTLRPGIRAKVSHLSSRIRRPLLVYPKSCIYLEWCSRRDRRVDSLDPVLTEPEISARNTVTTSDTSNHYVLIGGCLHLRLVRILQTYPRANSH